MSHVDETNPKTDKVYSKEDIEKLLQEARKQIGVALESESNDVLIMPIGSKQGFSDREYTDEIRASVPHGGCCKIQSPPACLNNSIARLTCQRKKEAKQC